jgi:hypothetical protein
LKASDNKNSEHESDHEIPSLSLFLEEFVSAFEEAVVEVTTGNGWTAFLECLVLIN